MDPNVLKSVMSVWNGGNNRRSCEGDVLTTAIDASEMAMKRASSPKVIPLRSSSSLALAFVAPRASRLDKGPNLLSLPPEIIQQIARLLRRPNAACFTFTCKRIQKILGTQYWDMFRRDLGSQELIIQHWLKNSIYEQLSMSSPSVIERSEEGVQLCLPDSTLQRHNARLPGHCHDNQCHCIDEWKRCQNANLLARRQLLALLARDVPDRVRCGRCIMLHKPARRVSAVDANDLRECEASDERMGVGRVLYEGFTFTHLQQAMKYFRLGNPNIRSYLKSLSSSSTTTTHSTDLSRRHIVQTNHKFRIIADQMLVRTQYWILFPQTIALSPTIQIDYFLSSQQICAHLSFGDPDRNRLASSLVEKQVLLSKGKKYLDDVLRCRVLHRGSEEGQICGCMSVHRCRFCETEFQIDVKGIGKGLAIVVTKWCNLGAGDMWQDPKWTRHFLQDPLFQNSNKLGISNAASFETLERKEENYGRPKWVSGAIRDAFERGRRFEFERCLRPSMEKVLVEEMEKVRVLGKRERVLSEKAERLRVERKGVGEMRGLKRFETRVGGVSLGSRWG